LKHYTFSNTQNARVLQEDLVRVAVRDLKLSLHITRSVVEGSHHSKCLGATTIGSVDNRLAGHRDAAKIVVAFKHNIHMSVNGATFLVVLRLNCEVEFPVLCRVAIENWGSIRKAEFEHVKLAGHIVGRNVANSRACLVLNRTDVFPIHFGGGCSCGLNSDGVVETTGLKGHVLVSVAEPVLEFVAASGRQFNSQFVVAAGIVTMLMNFNIVGQLCPHVIDGGFLASLLKVDDIQIAWWVPEGQSGSCHCLICLIAGIVSDQSAEVIAIKVRGLYEC